METRKQRGDYDGKIAGLYDLEDTIGRGHFAVVKLARHVFTGEKVAVKVIDKTKLDEISRSHLFQEVRCMKLVQHPNVVRLYEVIDTQTKLYLILELGDGGDMYDYIMKHDGGLEENIARRYFRQIVEAISYCHQLHVVHRDLKPENVVFFEKLGIVKLTDFGFSNMFNPGKNLETSCGSLAYSAPEILLGDSYDAPAVDVWSLGVILFMLVCGQAPFQEANDSETLTMIMDCKFKLPDRLSLNCKDLIKGMLIREPSGRLNLDAILHHQWVSAGGDYSPVSYMPLISHEHLTHEDHSYVVQRMVEGKIASKDEIVSSLDKGSYDHITATYYLLAERKLRKHQQEMQMALASQVQKHSGGGGPGQKPHLEPLSLSPRRPREVKKTKTAPLGWGEETESLTISPVTLPVSADGSLTKPVFMKTLTSSMTLDRKNSQKKRPEQSGSVTPSGCDNRPVTQLTENTVLSQSNSESNKKTTSVASKFSKIAILSSFFERKAATAVGQAPKPNHKPNHKPDLKPAFLVASARKRDNVKQKLLNKAVTPNSPPFLSLEGLDTHFQGAQPSQSESREGIKSTYMQSLVSPPGTHPAPSTSTSINPGSPDKLSRGRKCSLIKEESQDEPQDQGYDMDVDEVSMMKPVQSCASLEELANSQHQIGPTHSQHQIGPTQSVSHGSVPQMAVKQTLSPVKDVGSRWPLKSVNSSPQLLNQICEENESDEEEDFVPSKLHSPRPYSSMASPEILRKYEQRKKRRGAGQRGTSCSSSDASDTDDTEGRSRKDKLKHKFVHRRDSSDHSSDTDGAGGPGGNVGGGARFSGGGGSASDGQGGSRKDSGKKDKSSDNRGGSKGGDGQGSKQKHADVSHQAELNLKALSRKLSELSSGAGDASGTASGTSPWTIGSAPIQYLGCSDAEFYTDAQPLHFSELSEYSEHDFNDGSSVCSSDCVLLHPRDGRGHSKVITDINSNGVAHTFCKPVVLPPLSVIKVESKCCSVV